MYYNCYEQKFMKTKIRFLGDKVRHFGIYILMILLVAVGCKKDNSSKIQTEMPLSINSLDLSTRLSTIKRDFISESWRQSLRLKPTMVSFGSLNGLNLGYKRLTIVFLTFFIV